MNEDLKMSSSLKNLSFLKISRVFFYLFFAFLPFQIDALFWAGGVYNSGFFSTYLSHFIFASDVFLLLSLFFLALSLLFNSRGVVFEKFGIGDRKLFLLISLFVLANVVSLFFSVNLLNSVIYSLRLLEFFVVYILLVGGFVRLERLLYVFIGVMSFVAFIGIFQYLRQASLGLQFFGEPILATDMLGVSKLAILDQTILRSYGTFPHPNIFAGYLVVTIFLILHFLKKSRAEKKIIFSLLLIVCSLALLLTFSRSAMLALIGGILLYYAVSNLRISLKYILLVFVLIAFFTVIFDLSSVLVGRILIGDDGGFEERIKLLSISKKMFFENIFGVGAGNFTAVMQDYSLQKIMPWTFQPVHNLYLLVLNQLGIQGLVVFLLFFVYMFVSLLKTLPRLSVEDGDFVHILMAIWLAIFVIGLFDHYFVSLYQGQALFWMFVGICGWARRGSLDFRL